MAIIGLFDSVRDNGVKLVGLFAYTEGRVGRRWWNDLRSVSAKRDLRILWRARNAFVHKDSKLVPSEFNSADQIEVFAHYFASLKNGELTDDKGNVYPIWITLDNSVIRFNKEAINQFRSLFEVAFQAERLGRMRLETK